MRRNSRPRCPSGFRTPPDPRTIVTPLGMVSLQVFVATRTAEGSRPPIGRTNDIRKLCQPPHESDDEATTMQPPKLMRMASMIHAGDMAVWETTHPLQKTAVKATA